MKSANEKNSSTKHPFTVLHIKKSASIANDYSN